MEYFRLKKGSQCYSPTTKRSYMSIDFTVFKDTFFLILSGTPASIQDVLPVPKFGGISEFK